MSIKVGDIVGVPVHAICHDGAHLQIGSGHTKRIVWIGTDDIKPIPPPDPHAALKEAMARAIWLARRGNAEIWDWLHFRDGSGNKRKLLASAEDCHRDAKAARIAMLSHIDAAGWQLVPKVATPDMLIESGIAWSDAAPLSETVVDCAHACYVAALAAAPKFGGPDAG
jgi:hypothetical protein